MTAQLDRTEAPKILASLDNQAQEAVSILLQIQQDTPDQIAHVIEALRVLRIIPGDERHSIAATVPFVTPDTLRKHTLELQFNVDLRLLLPYLLSDELLTYDEQLQLTNQIVPYTERIANLVLWVSRKGPNGPTRLLQCLRRSVIENPGAAAGHAFVDELLSKASCLTEQTINADGQMRRYQQGDDKRSVKFATLVREVWKKLHTIGPEELKLFIRSLDESLASGDCKELIKNAKNTGEVLDVLSNSRSSNYRDTRLLTVVVAEFCNPDDELVMKLQQYNQELEEERLEIATNLTVMPGNPESEFQEQTGKTGSPPPPAKKYCRHAMPHN